MQTLERAVGLLSLFCHERPMLSLSQIAESLNLHISTVHRLVGTLENAGYLDKEPRSGHYRLGFAPVELAGLALNQTDFVRHALPELDQLRDELQLNANLAVLYNDDIIHLAYAVRRDTPRYYTVIGRRAVPHCTALGKVLLSELPRSAVHQMIKRQGWRPYTPHSISDYQRLDEELDAVSKRGYATDLEERHVGHACVAAPIRDNTTHIVAALSVTGELALITGDRGRDIISAVLEHAKRVSLQVGYMGHS